MHSLIIRLLSVLIGLSGIVSGFEVEGDALCITDVPPCGVQLTLCSACMSLIMSQLKCLLATVPAASCSLTDIECLYKNQDLAYNTAACILASCSMASSLAQRRFRLSSAIC